MHLDIDHREHINTYPPSHLHDIPGIKEKFPITSLAEIKENVPPISPPLMGFIMFPMFPTRYALHRPNTVRNDRRHCE